MMYLMMFVAPIALFAYKRLDTLARTVDALRRNDLAAVSNLIIFSDAAKSESEENAVCDVRRFIKTVVGFREVRIVEGKHNKGLSKSIIDGVTEVLNEFGSVIVLEDDLVTSSKFLKFMNSALGYYERNSSIFSIGGYTKKMVGLNRDKVYFTLRGSSWGWATWANRWNLIDWEVRDYAGFSRDRIQRRKFNRMGSDLSSMLDKQMIGKIDSWAIRACFHQFKNELYSVFPATSKVANIGFGSSATNTKEKFNRFHTDLDESDFDEFVFSKEVKLDSNLLNQFVKPYSIGYRIKYKLINVLMFN